MAFQSGTQIRPELANADFSGFQNAANIQANAMADFGASIASGIKGYKKRKKDEKIGQAKINRSIAFGESMIDMLGEDHPLADSIADQLAMSFGENVPFEQKIAATEGLSTEITNMFLMSQKNQAPTFTRGPEGGMIVNIGGKNEYVPPYKMQAGDGGLNSLNSLFNDADRNELEELRRQRDLAAQQTQP
tara:strand:- start:1953 stop:2522 length:570 start_codon:yes stop_codon:yes gene_type:complete